MKKYIKPETVMQSIDNEPFMAASQDGKYKISLHSEVSSMPAMSKKHSWGQCSWDDEYEEESEDESLWNDK